MQVLAHMKRGTRWLSLGALAAVFWAFQAGQQDPKLDTTDPHLLTTAQYRDLQTAIADFQRNMPKWTLFDTNCNWFAAKMALAAGLKAEAWRNLLPTAFVAAIESANRAPPPERRQTVLHTGG